LQARIERCIHRQYVGQYYSIIYAISASATYICGKCTLSQRHGGEKISSGGSGYSQATGNQSEAATRNDRLGSPQLTQKSEAIGIRIKYQIKNQNMEVS
jgi:hypothetical protein